MLEEFGFTGPMTQITSILIGLAVLTLGRKLFWLFVGAVGFILGLGLAVNYLSQQPDWVLLVAALLMGIGGALVAIVVQKIAVGVAGFIMGGYAVLWLLRLFAVSLASPWELLIVLVGGIIGIILAIALFDVALIVLSSLAGALLIVQATNFNPTITALLFIGLAGIGVVIQVSLWREATYHDKME